MFARTLVLLAVPVFACVTGAEISVGPGRGLTRIEDALPLAKSGDSIVIHARGDGQPYAATALRLLLPHLSVRGMPDSSGRRPVLDGGGAVFAGADAPRAIIAIGPEAEGATVSGLQLSGGRGEGVAGIRIDSADRVTVEDCEITACDSGLLSTGTAESARELLISGCDIHHNAADNVVLGGGGGRVVGCSIHHALAGRDVVSRAQRTVLEACWLYAAAAAELDLLDDAGVTDRAGGLMLVLGCVLAQGADGAGARPIIRCGQDRGGDRLGTLYLEHDTVLTPSTGPVIELSAAGPRTAFANCIIADPNGGGPGRRLVGRRGGEASEPDWAGGLWLAFGYAAPRGTVGVTVGAAGDVPPFVDLAAIDLRLAVGAGAPFVDSALPLAQLPLPVSALQPEHPLRQRQPHLLRFNPGHPAEVRVVVGEGLDLGAYEAETAKPTEPSHER